MDNDQRNLSGEPGTLFEDSTSSDTIVGAALGLATALGGGFLCGWMIDQFAPVGSISLWALGFVSGFTATKLTQTRNNTTACILVVACVLAFIVAEVCWIRWNIQGVESWTGAITKFPLFLKQFRLDAFIAVIFTFFGGQSAYRQTAAGRGTV
jgi:hypothetical protein